MLPASQRTAAGAGVRARRSGRHGGYGLGHRGRGPGHHCGQVHDHGRGEDAFPPASPWGAGARWLLLACRLDVAAVLKTKACLPMHAGSFCPLACQRCSRDSMPVLCTLCTLSNAKGRIGHGEREKGRGHCGVVCVCCAGARGGRRIGAPEEGGGGWGEGQAAGQVNADEAQQRWMHVCTKQGLPSMRAAQSPFLPDHHPHPVYAAFRIVVCKNVPYVAAAASARHACRRLFMRLNRP